MQQTNHKIRIIGGAFKGKQLTVLNSEGLRPTIDRARETLFNWISSKVQGARVIDLFAGSGALGLEALSRGAADVTLIEKDHVVFTQLQSSVATLPPASKDAVSVLNTDALLYLQRTTDPAQKPFDLVFLDPPFAEDLLETAVELLVEKDLLADDALVYVEMSRSGKKTLFGLEMLREATVGASHLGLYKKSSLF